MRAALQDCQPCPPTAEVQEQMSVCLHWAAADWTAALHCQYWSWHPLMSACLQIAGGLQRPACLKLCAWYPWLACCWMPAYYQMPELVPESRCWCLCAQASPSSWRPYHWVACLVAAVNQSAAAAWQPVLNLLLPGCPGRLAAAAC